MKNQKPIIGITMGDPASIGPEITIKALCNERVYGICRPLVVGDLAVLQEATKIPGIPQVAFNAVQSVAQAEFKPGVLDVLDLGAAAPGEFPRGAVSAKAGDAAFQYVKKVIALAMAGQVNATVTNALNKEALNLAGHHYSGHTEIYADLTGTKKYTMMLADGPMRVVHVSTHVSLREACDLVKKERVLEVIRIANRACQDMSIAEPRIGVAGLNPHSGENGLFGREEIDEIIPAVQAAQKEGILADGPVPPDSLFPKVRGGWYDIAVAMYHDQGHIPLKVLGFVYNRERGVWDAVKGVNITLGLPIIRTSVDHGTAFDQAGQGTASAASLVNAIEYAVRFADTRNHNKESKEKKQ